MNPPAEGWSLTLTRQHWADLSEHLFSDGGEHGAVLLAGTAPGPRGPRLLGRELILAADGADYVPGQYGYRALSTEFVRAAALRAADHGLAYLAIHNHAGQGQVTFSGTDMASHERGYPALRQLTGQIAGGLVFTPYAAAGDLWLPDGTRASLAEVIIPTSNLIRMRPRPARATRAADDGRYDRQARLYGDLGQETLRRLRVAVVGLGGVGSIMVELLARLGVGHLVLIEDDLVDQDGTNLPRMVAAEPDDTGKPKTELAVRNARRANPDIDLTVISRRAEHPDAQAALTLCDWIFLAADGQAARHYTTKIANQYLIPATQAGVKIPVNSSTGDIGEIHAIIRLLLPGQGCMWCNNLIDPTKLAVDMLPVGQRQAARYVEEAPAPAVIALNAITASEAIDHFMLAVTGLHYEDVNVAWTLHQPRARQRSSWAPRQDAACPWCSNTGILGSGPGGDRPARAPRPPQAL
jgi:molybdopterin/thiamine biosynthesis adenylyltransferase